ncbi:hypothetical protein SDRG_17195 [Saprolegnia diclina VS20]|uniref:Uncharacterized protein n=1 Tax=Saprolegnia diclina (strain VS20) TaxID=1156394 RepID=T0PHT0_SAPDV|nr:hypothetical protein SDRG_17195 [Saprolegnia diclina VS20]EQC24914.1 hypothetical protein SDRG_17195 [Saprolegnia diclina VS20]|eukprot:XP_008621655.1 hypothetical protein SDRG_17195 [Saprolegnia diclina VS20]
MEVAFVSGALQVVVAVVNNVLGKPRVPTDPIAQRQVELQHELLEAKKRCVALELELADVTLKLTKQEDTVKQRRLKHAVEQLQLQIRWQRLERRHRLHQLRLWLPRVVGLFALAFLVYAAVASIWQYWPRLFASQLQ